MTKGCIGFLFVHLYICDLVCYPEGCHGHYVPSFEEYLNKIAEHANLDPANSRHGVFWDTDYHSFITGNVPKKQCNGKVVPIIDPVNKVNSAFYQILRARWCDMPQMPKTGPFVTDPDYSITLQDGTKVSGNQILKDIEDWLRGGALENG